MGTKLFHGIEFRECLNDHPLFYEFPRGGRMQLRTRYLRYQCKKCLQFDPRKAAKAGFDPGLPKHAPKVDAFCTRDDQTLFTDRALATWARILPGTLQSWRIGDSGWSLVMPKKLVFPKLPVNKDRTVAPAFRAADKRGTCRSCGRFYELTLEDGRVRLAPSQKMVGYWVDKGEDEPPIIAWVCDDATREQLKKNKIAGLHVVKDEFGPTAPRWLEFQKRMSDPNSELRRILDGTWEP